MFAAQFALSHACWLITYPIAGRVGASIGLPATFVLFGVISTAAYFAAQRLWPENDPDVLAHTHDELPHDYEHLADAVWTEGGYEHSHGYVIDDRHPVWPRG